MSNSPNCILRTAETNQLARETKIDPIIVTAKIASWQAVTGRIGDIPTVEEFKEYLSTQNQNPIPSSTIKNALGEGKDLQIQRGESDEAEVSSSKTAEGISTLILPRTPISVDKFIDSLDGTKLMARLERSGFTLDQLRGLVLTDNDVEEFLIFREISKLKNSNVDPERDMRFAWAQMTISKTDFDNIEAENALNEDLKEGWVTYAPKGKAPQDYQIKKGADNRWHIYNRQGEEVYKVKNGKSNKDRKLIFGQLGIAEGRTAIVEIGNDSYLVNNNGKITNMQTGRVIGTNVSNALTRQIRLKARKIFNPDAPDVEYRERGEFNWARTSDKSFEVSTQGTPLGQRFSAWNAKFAPGTTIDGVEVPSDMSLEKVYQTIIKKSSKGQAPSAESKLHIDNIKASEESMELLREYSTALADKIENDETLSKEELEDISYIVGYLPLWRVWAEQNPELLAALRKNASGKTLTDKFANTRVSQARALADILNEQRSHNGKRVQRKPLPQFATKWSATKEGPGYSSRTRENASWADVTISFAPVTWSKGEALTKREAAIADKGFLFFNPFESLEHIDDGYQIKSELEALGLPTQHLKLNIAGNTLATVNEWERKKAEKAEKEPHVYTQEEYDAAVQAILQSMLDAGITIDEVRTGGQTGADVAGSNAAYTLGIKNTVVAPQGWGHQDAEGNEIWGNYDAFVSRFKSWQDAHADDDPATKKWTRESIQNDPESLYIFTDNTDRDSGKHLIDPNSKYAQKYGKDKHYPTMTTAVARGLDNAMPISTQRWYHEDAKGIAGRWQDADAEEFERTISEEVDAIIEEWNTGAYKQVKIPSGDGLFNAKISDISKKRVPKLYSILQAQYRRLEDAIGKDNIIGPTASKSAAVLTLGQSDQYNAAVEKQDGVQKKENVDGLIVNAALDALNHEAANYQSTTEGISDMETELSPTARLSIEFTPQERADRTDFLARRFSETLDQLVDEERNKVDEQIEEALQAAMQAKNNRELWNRFSELRRKRRKLYDDVKGRRLAMQSATKDGATGLEAVFKMIRASVEEFRDGADDPIAAAKYQKILDNFTQLMKNACQSLESIEGFQVVAVDNKATKITTESITDAGSELTAEEQALRDEQFGDDEDGSAVASGNDGWSFKIRFVNPRTSLSKGVKKVLNRLMDVDYNGEPQFDDLGQPRYRNGEQSHAILLNELSNMVDADDFYNPDATGYDRYPALNRLVEKYPWVKQVMNALDENPELIGSFFADFNQAFISYWKHDDSGNPMPLNETVAKDAAMQDFIRNYERSTQLDKHSKSIYTTGGKIQLDAVKEALGVVDDLLRRENRIDFENCEPEARDLARALRMMGLGAKDDYVLRLLKTLILDAEDGQNDNLHKLLTSMKDILEGVQDNTRFNENSHLVDTFRQSFGNIAEIAGEVSELDNIMSFRDGDKTRYSYSAPNYAISLVKKFKSDVRRDEFMQTEFADYPWFMEDGEYLSSWLDMLGGSDSFSEQVRDKLHLKEVISIGTGKKTKEYSEWTPDDVRNVLISEYFSQGRNPKAPQYHGHNVQWAYYNFPIFADSPVAMFIRMPRFEGNFRAALLPMFRNVVKQELIRIKQVDQRHARMQQLINEGRLSEAASMEIQNFDKNGAKFCFFPELNNETVDGVPFKQAAQQYLDAHDTTNLDRLIDSTMRTILDRLCEDFIKGIDLQEQAESLIKKDIIVDEKNDDLNAASAKEKLEEYFWNSTFATSQIIEITTTDLAFYKNGVDFQKRFKEVYAAGTRLNTNTKYGRKTERYIILKDQIITSSNYVNIRKSLDDAVREKRMSAEQAEAIAKKFKEVNVADAQAFRNPYAFRAILDMMGSWTKDMEQSFERFINGTWDKIDFDILWQTIKPFMFTNIHKDDGVGGAIRVPHQNKNSEFLVLAAYSMVAAGTQNSQFLKGIGKFFEAHQDIDLIQFESAVKAGGQGKVDLTYDPTRVARVLQGRNTETYDEVVNGVTVTQKPFLEWFGATNLEDIANTLIRQEHKEDWKGKSEQQIEAKLANISDYDKLNRALVYLLETNQLRQDAYNEIMQELELTADEVVDTLEDCIKDPNTGTTNIEEGVFNHDVIHEASYADYMIAQPTPEHLIDVDEATAGSQFRNLALANLPADFTMTLPGSDRVLTKPEILRLYRAAITDNLLDSYAEVAETFGDIEKLRERLLKLIQGNPKYGDDLIEALEIVEVTNPITGEKQKVFNLPLDTPTITNQIQELVTSAFKNKVTKQKIKGGNAILVANVGLTRELNVVRDPKTNNVVGVECYLPAWSKKFFNAFTTTRTEIDENTGKEVTFEEVDIQKMEKECPDLLKMVGYRIPTEDKYSMLPLIVKGFLPQQNGSAIMVAADVTTLAGSDFDVDKMFLRIPAFDKDTLKKITYDLGNSEDIADATKYMSKEQRDNLMIDLEFGVLTSKTGSEQMFNPGTFDTAKKMARVSDILSSVDLLTSWAAAHDLSISDVKGITDSLHNASLDDLTDFLKGNSKEVNSLTPQAFVYYHGQNMVGNALVGIYANGSSIHTKMQDATLNIIDSQTFIINGRTIKKMDAIYNGLGESIQHNIAEFQNASVDNVKDPILAKLKQNPSTADTMLFMLRAGLSIEEASLLFSNPLTGVQFGKTRGLFKLLARDYKFKLSPTPLTNESMTAAIINGTIYKDFFDQLRYIGSHNLSSASFEKAMTDLHKLIRSNAELQANLENILNTAMGPMAAYSQCEELSAKLKQGNSILKADSPNNAIDTTIAGAIRQEREVQLFTIISDDKSAFPFEGSTEHVSDEFIKSGVITVGMTREQMREALLKQRLPSVQAFYSLGIELPIYTMSKYFIHGNPLLRDALKYIMDNSKNGMLETADIKEFFNGFIKFALSKTDIFGTDFDTKRSYHVHTFPQRVLAEITSNPALAANPTMQRLSHNTKPGTSNYNAIEYRRSGKTTPYMKGVIRMNFNQLLFDEDTLVFAKKLLSYAYYHDGFAFGPNNFGYFLDATFLSRFPEVVDTLRNAKTNITEEMVASYIEMYLANNPETIRTIDVKLDDETATQVRFTGDTKYKVANPLTRYGYQDYINTLYGLFKLDPSTVDGTLVYNKVATFNTPQPVYNANSTVGEMQKLYYTDEADESNVVVKYDNETPEDAPSQTEVIERSGQTEDSVDGDQEEVDQDLFYNVLQNRLNQITDDDLRSSTADRMSQLVTEAEEAGDTFDVLFPKLKELLDSVMEKNEGECNVPNKKHKYR